MKDYGDHELWEATKIRFFFTVPRYGPDKVCGEHELEMILAEIDSLQEPPT